MQSLKSKHMNKLTTFILSLLVAVPLWAEEHDNRLYLTVGEITESNQVELSLYLENPSIALTAVELYVVMPEGATLSAGLLAERAAQHELTEGTVEGNHFVSIASPSLATFTGQDGVLCSWVCDLSQVNEVEPNIFSTDLFAVGVSESGVTAYTVTTSVTAPSAPRGTLVIYDIQGKRLSAPQKGQVNIVNGRKVLL